MLRRISNQLSLAESPPRRLRVGVGWDNVKAHAVAGGLQAQDKLRQKRELCIRMFPLRVLGNLIHNGCNSTFSTFQDNGLGMATTSTDRQ
eukprot:2557435-Amphidinium_carterae.1